MVRNVNAEEYAAKRNEILDAAQLLIFTKGYGRMTIQDLLDALGMSNGAFYHYFDSKPAVLEALIERMLRQAEGPLFAVLHDPHLPAPDKLQGFFDTLNSLRVAGKTFLTGLMRVWYADDNAIVRQKVEAATLERRAAALSEVIRQGIQEGALTTLYPGQAGEIVASLVQSMGNTHARLLLSTGQGGDTRPVMEAVAAAHAAYMDAIERVLGIPTGYLHRYGADSVEQWVTELGNDARNTSTERGVR